MYQDGKARPIHYGKYCNAYEIVPATYDNNLCPYPQLKSLSHDSINIKALKIEIIGACQLALQAEVFIVSIIC